MALYKVQKLKLLHQLGIKITPDIISHMDKLTTEVAIDNYAHTLIIGE